MKLLKALGAVLLTFVVMFGFTSCNSNFCSEEETANLKQKIQNQLETGTGYYATTENLESWEAATTEDEKSSVVDNIFTKQHPQACLTYEQEQDQTTGVDISQKSWKFAFSKGFFDGLLTYPIGFLMDKIARWLGLNGWGQLLSIIFVTLIIRLVTTLATWKPTMAQQRMQMIQPEMAEINAKYGGTKDPQLKQKQAQELMDLYKKYKINPLTTTIVPFITLPIFIGIYGAVRAVTVLKEDQILGIELGKTLSTGIKAGNITAIVLFIILAAIQFISMKLPQWINKDKLAKMDPKAREQSKQTQMFSYVMVIMVVVIGWSLPVSMSIYWIASSLFSIAQMFVVKKIQDKQKHKEKEATFSGNIYR